MQPRQARENARVQLAIGLGCGVHSNLFTPILPALLLRYGGLAATFRRRHENSKYTDK